jgi:hypothetical protein
MTSLEGTNATVTLGEDGITIKYLATIHAHDADRILVVFPNGAQHWVARDVVESR